MLEKLKEDLKKSIIAKDKIAANTIRGILAAISNQKEKTSGSTKDTIRIIQKEIKKRREAITMYGKNNRNDLKQIEESELKILLSYMPKQMPEGEVKREIMKIYTNLSSNKETSIGELIRESIDALSSDSDNATISRIAKEVLQSK
jgi:uncharacterized protein YqeY